MNILKATVLYTLKWLKGTLYVMSIKSNTHVCVHMHTHAHTHTIEMALGHEWKQKLFSL